MAKPKVLSIQASLSRDVNSEKSASNEAIIAKSLIIKSPNIIPPKRDSMTFFEYRAKVIASKEGRRERAESSISFFLELYAHEH